MLIKSLHSLEHREATATVTLVHHRLEVKIHKIINKTSMEVNRRLRLTLENTENVAHSQITFKHTKSFSHSHEPTTFRVVQFLDCRQFPIKCLSLNDSFIKKTFLFSLSLSFFIFINLVTLLASLELVARFVVVIIEEKKTIERIK